MRKSISLLAVTALVATTAAAQMKPKAPTTVTKTKSSPFVVTGVQQPAPAPEFKRISRDEAYKLYRKGEAVLVDVRSNAKFSVGHIKGAVNIPNSQLIARLKELPAGKMIITYCACPAEESSGRAVLTLNAHGVKNVAALTGGWDVWKASQLPIAAGPK